MVLQKDVEAALGAGRSQRVAERAGYRHGWKQRKRHRREKKLLLKKKEREFHDFTGKMCYSLFHRFRDTAGAWCSTLELKEELRVAWSLRVKEKSGAVSRFSPNSTAFLLTWQVNCSI